VIPAGMAIAEIGGAPGYLVAVEDGQVALDV
jgi:hypothetical protein